jgi:alpha-beta hydrolase superfamily lysophospholipase
MAAVPAADRDTPRGQRELKVIGMMLEEPNIEAKALEAITAPTLVLASDHDTIVDQHTVVCPLSADYQERHRPTGVRNSW